MPQSQEIFDIKVSCLPGLCKCADLYVDCSCSPFKAGTSYVCCNCRRTLSEVNYNNVGVIYHPEEQETNQSKYSYSSSRW